jgi:Spy/CpxP family protein refolding chaperone
MFEKIKPYLVILSIGLNIAFVSIWLFYAYPPAWFYGYKSFKSGGHNFYRQRLNVSEEQWEKLKPELDSFFERVKQQRERLFSARKELLLLLASEDSTPQDVEAKKKEIVELHSELQDIFIAHARTHREVLNPEQCNRFFKMLRRKFPSKHHRPHSKRSRHKHK